MGRDKFKVSSDVLYALKLYFKKIFVEPFRMIIEMLLMLSGLEVVLFFIFYFYFYKFSTSEGISLLFF